MLDTKLTFGGAFCLSKYSYEQRLETVKLVTERHMSFREAARYLGTDSKHAMRWVKRYEQFGIEGLLLKHGTYTGDFKKHVIEYMHENNLSISETAVLFGIPTDVTVGKWERIYYEEGPTALYRDGRGHKTNMSSDKPKRQKAKNEADEDLLAEVERLRMENAYLKKLNALVQERIAQESGKKQPPSMN
jgi:transposase